MAISNGAFLKNHYSAATSLGAKAINSDFMMTIDGFEEYAILLKQAPWAELSPQGEIEIPMPMGSKMWQPQQVSPAQQGQIAIFETIDQRIDNMMIDLISNSGAYRGAHGTFNCWIYEGTVDKYIVRKRYLDCFCQMDPLDRDWENRSQPLMWSGTLFFHYFGEKEKGNSTDYR